MSRIPRPKPLAGNNPGQNSGPTKNQARKAKKPMYQEAGDWVRDVGGRAEKSVGHAAHDAKHGIGKVIDKLNPFD